MKRALIISYYWPPTGGSGVQRWVKFAKYLPAEGWQPVIYTPSNPEALAIDKSLVDEIPPEVEVIKRKIFEPYGIYRRLLGRKSASDGGSDEVNPVNGQKKTLKQRLFMAIRGNLFIPDPRCLWIKPSIRFLKKYLKSHPVDIIISTGPPHSMHLIALGLARATGLPWIADFRDPWTRLFYFKHLSMTGRVVEKHRKLEKTVLDSASAVVAVSPLVRRDFMEMTGTRVELITNGYDESDFDDAVVENDGYFNITHTGLFAADGNPTVLWEILADKCRNDREFKEMLRIRLAGKTDKEVIDSIKKAGLGTHLRDNGYQPHQVAVKEQKNSSVLLLPLRKEPEYKAVLPGKLFEYMAAGRPILGIGQPDGAMAMVMEESKTGKVFDWDDSAAISGFIDKCWEMFRNDDMESSAADISSYSRRALTGKMASLMDSLIENQSQDN